MSQLSQIDFIALLCVWPFAVYIITEYLARRKIHREKPKKAFLALGLFLTATYLICQLLADVMHPLVQISIISAIAIGFVLAWYGGKEIERQPPQ